LFLLFPSQHFDSHDKKAIRRSPLARKIFETDGVKNVFLGKDFITITKKPAETWKVLKTLVFSAILDHFASGEPSVVDQPLVSDTQILEEDSEVVALIKELIETKVRPSVQDDGGDIFFVKFDEQSGLVSVRLAGSCVGCPSSSITLRNGVENMLKHYIPEVKGLLEAPPEEDDEAAHDTTHSLQFHPTT
jgi:NFU1 iron-sulfur cluster scaffold homolog, mitochondrial